MAAKISEVLKALNLPGTHQERIIKILQDSDKYRTKLHSGTFGTWTIDADPRLVAEYIKEVTEEKNHQEETRALENIQQMTVTTADLKQDYDVIGPVFYQISNKGFLSNSLAKGKEKYRPELRALYAQGQLSNGSTDLGLLYGEFSVGQNDFSDAFFIALQELKERAKLVGADAIVGLRQDIDIDTNGFSHFYLQMYGTAVKLKQ